METIYSGQDIVVFLEPGSADVAVFSFSGHGMHKADNPRYGDGFFRKLGVTGVYFTTRDDHWWQSGEMPAAVAAANAATAGIARRIAYGQSMGGFGAAAFARDLHADYLITAPQLSVRPEEVLLNPIWEQSIRLRPVLYPNAAQRLSGLSGTIIYDPRHRIDPTHARLLNGLAGQHRRLIVPFGSHFIPRTLTEMGIFSTLVADLVLGRAKDLAFYRRIIRENRMKSSRYVEMLSALLPQRPTAGLWRLAEGHVLREIRRTGAGAQQAPHLFAFLESYDSAKWGPRSGAETTALAELAAAGPVAPATAGAYPRPGQNAPMGTMKIKLETTNTSTKIRSYLNPQLASQLQEGRIVLSGWAYDPDGAIPEVAIRTPEATFHTDLKTVRPDVEQHLLSRGFGHIRQPLGYRFDFLFTPGMEVGYRIGDRTEWIYRLSADTMVEFPRFDSLPALVRSEEGVCGNVYFHDGPDWSKAIVMFNGALTPGKVAAEKAVFQRWSWARQFRHPVFCIADPLTLGEDPIVLGWYLGASGRNALPALLEPVLAAIRDRAPECRILGFGSSGGGFAALGGTLLGLLDAAIVINPQIDALKFEVQSAVQDFLRKRNGTACDSDLKAYDMSRMKPQARIFYLQNRFDRHHLDVHYRPFREACTAAGLADRISFIEYEDEKAGHMPPDMADTKKILGEPFSALLRA